MSSSDTVAQIISTAQTLGVDPNLALSVAEQESGLNQSAIGAAGEIGIFQLMPATAASLGVDPTNLTQNIQGGIGYLAQLLSQFGGDEQKALAAYNWAPGNVTKAVSTGGSAWLSLAPGSTQSYVASIMANASANPAGTGVQYASAPAVDDSSGDSTTYDPTTGQPVSTAGLSFAGLSVGTIALLVGLGVLFFVLQED
jgi:hypothetical protein